MSSESRKISRYQLKHLIGAGAMGEVYCAYDPALARHVAIKTLQASQARTPEDLAEFEQRFYQEAQIYARLNHPNIVSVFDCGVEAKAPFLVMELVEAKPLDLQLRPLGMKRFQLLVPILEQIAAGLHYAHQAGVIHRDIKPGNILLNDSGRIKIIDFGLGKLVDTRMTQAGMFLGTPSYASPEQVIGGKIDHRSDVYSFATLAYELLTGHLPFDSTSLQVLLFQIAQAPPRIALEHFADYLDIHLLNDLFERVFQKKPEARYPTIESFFSDLREALSGLRNLQRNSTLTLERLGFPKAAQPRSEAPLVAVQVEPLAPASTKLPDPLAKPLQEPVARAPKEPPIRSQASESARKAPTSAQAEPPTQPIDKLPPFHPIAPLETPEVSQARRQFEAAYKTGNLASVRFSLLELERLGAATAQERQAVATLETLEAENQAKRDQLHREREIQKLREQLRLAVEARNLSSSRYCLEELRKNGVDTHQEFRAIDELESQLREAEAERNRRAAEQERRRLHVEKLRGDFRQAWGMRDLGRLQELVAQLRQFQVNTDSELNALESLRTKLDSEQKQRKVWLEKAQAQFKQAIQDGRNDRCRQLIFEMENLLRVDTSAEKAELDQLEALQAAEASKVARQAQASGIRDEFRIALGRREISTCSKLIQDLRAIDEKTEKEERALSLLRKQVQEVEAQRFKSQLIAKLRQKFQDSLAADDLTFSRHYLSELAQLVPDTQAERLAVETLQAKLHQRESENQRESLRKRIREGFAEAIKKRDINACRDFIQDLRALSLDASEQEQQLAQLEAELQEHQQKRDALANHAREAFSAALQQKDLSRSEHYLKVLSELGIDIREERRQLASMRKKIRESRDSLIQPSEKEKLRNKMIEQFRFEFILAFQEGRANGCRFYLNELRQLGADIHSEEEAMGHLDNDVTGADFTR